MSLKFMEVGCVIATVQKADEKHKDLWVGLMKVDIGQCSRAWWDQSGNQFVKDILGDLTSGNNLAG
jgi:hypothetical protein